ncbi:hypothetical protein HY251_15695 [bacterium]|nr:hypothetical protein [bacterium]
MNPAEADPAKEIVATHITETGVQVTTVGSLCSESFRRLAVALVKKLEPNGAYAEYKAIKRPNGADPTPDTRRQAYRHVMEAALRLSLLHYAR